MKRIPFLLSLFVIAVFAFPLSAETITFSATDLGNGIVQIGYDVTGGEAVPVAIGLRITIDNGSIQGTGDVWTGESAFNVYPDYYFSNYDYLSSLPGAFALPGTEAHPLADPYAAGVLSLGTPKSAFSVCMAAFDSYLPSSYTEDLNMDGYVDLMDLEIFSENWLATFVQPHEADINGDWNVDLADMALLNGGSLLPPSSSANLFSIQIADVIPWQTTLTLELDVLRGGIIVNQGAGAISVNLPDTLVLIPEPGTAVLLGLGAAILRRKR